jgi:hypothetical protein
LAAPVARRNVQALTDVIGRRYALMLTPDRISDVKAAPALIERARRMRDLLGDKGYDPDRLPRSLRNAGAVPFIPGRRNRKRTIRYDKDRCFASASANVITKLRKYSPKKSSAGALLISILAAGSPCLAGSLADDPLHDASADSKGTTDLKDPHALSPKHPDPVFYRGLDGAASEFNALRLSPRKPRVHTLPDDASFKLSEDTEHLEHGPAGRRRSIKALLVKEKVYILVTKPLQYPEQVR